MSYQDYGAIAKNTADGYIYILGQFEHIKPKTYGVHYFKDPSEIREVFVDEYDIAKTITEKESFDRQKIDLVGLTISGKRVRKRSKRAEDAADAEEVSVVHVQEKGSKQTRRIIESSPSIELEKKSKGQSKTKAASTSKSTQRAANKRKRKNDYNTSSKKYDDNTTPQLENLECTACGTQVIGWDVHICAKHLIPSQKEFVRCAAAGRCELGILVPVNGAHKCGNCKRSMHMPCGSGKEGSVSLCLRCMSQQVEASTPGENIPADTCDLVAATGADLNAALSCEAEDSSIVQTLDTVVSNVSNVFTSSSDDSESKLSDDPGKEIGQRSGHLHKRRGKNKAKTAENIYVTPSKRRNSFVALVNQKVAFSYDKEGHWMKKKKALYARIGNSLLIGTVKEKKGQVYKVIWDKSVINDSPMLTLETIQRGIRSYEKHVRHQLEEQQNPLTWDKLTESRDEVKIFNNVDALEEFPQEYSFPAEEFHTVEDVEEMMNVDFQSNVKLNPPKNLYCHENPSRNPLEDIPREEFAYIFEHSASASFFAYLPLRFWVHVVTQTNIYLAQKERCVRGCKNVKDFTLDELMAFLGILLYMELIQKGEYRNYWGEQFETELFNNIHGSENYVHNAFDKVLSLKRFEQLRTCLSFNSYVTGELLNTDPLARIRPLIRVFNINCGKFVIPGRNITIDESSVACRSKFGRGLIVYNPTKPGGKYHFRLYVMTTGDSFIILNSIVHSRCTLEDDTVQNAIGDMNDINDFIVEVEKCSALRKLMLVLSRPMHSTNRIMNTDNLYTDVRGMVQLRMKGLYSRGTIRKGRSHIPRQILYTKQELKFAKRGDFRFASDTNLDIVVASWVDGNEVHAMSNADGTKSATILRQTGGNRQEFPTLGFIKSYCKYMQGVDRCDQYRARLSLADGHSLKKWFSKLALAYIDLARTNAFLTRKLFCSRNGSKVHLNSRDPHREFVEDLCAELLTGTWRNVPDEQTRRLLYQTPVTVTEAESAFFSPRGVGCSSDQTKTSTTASPSFNDTKADTCTQYDSFQAFPEKQKRRKRMCKVCKWENRPNTVSTAYCGKHEVSLCLRVHPKRAEEEAKNYCCPDYSRTCWQKYHNFYLVQGLYTVSGSIKKKHPLYEVRKNDPDAVPLTA